MDLIKNPIFLFGNIRYNCLEKRQKDLLLLFTEVHGYL